MAEFIWGAVGIAVFAPAYLAIMSFITLSNVFKFLGWGFVLRITLVLEIVLIIGAAYKHINGGS